MENFSLAEFQPFIALRRYWLSRAFISLMLLTVFCLDSSIGQEVQGIGIHQIEAQNNRPALTGARAFVCADADDGEFGIGYVTFMLREGDESIERTGAAELVEANNRIFYSFVEAPAMRKLKTFLQIPLDNQIRAHKLWFLFKSSDSKSPLRLSMRGSGESRQVMVSVERHDRRKFEKYADRWRKEFEDAMAAQRAVNDYPPILEDYLESMLLGRVATEKSKKRDRKKKDKDQVKSLAKTVGLLLDLESTRSDLIAEAMNPLEAGEAGRVSLPLPIRLSVKPSEVLPASVDVEEIAKVVPATCFYLRFENWDNQIWLKDLMDEYGGDLSRMLTVRGYKKLVQSKFLDQLCVQSGPLDKWFGGTKVNDVALIGSDFYFRSGAGVGVVLQAQPNQTESLRKNFQDKRRKIVKEAKERILQRIPKASGLTIDDIDSIRQGTIESDLFAGHDVNFIETCVQRSKVKNENVLKATLDERVFYRSFYVVKGDFHLITTSAEIVKEFLEINQGKSLSLGESEDFKAFRARELQDKQFQNRILFYASNAFVENLFKPSFQIELLRRNRLSAKIQVLEMATLAAENEGLNFIGNGNVFAQLIDGGFLPRGFDKEGLERNGRVWVDQERGRFGFFKPLNDVSTEFCSEAERREYLDIENAVNDSIRALEPVYFYINRSLLNQDDKRIEVVSFDSRITAIGEDDLDWALGRLGPKMESEIAWRNSGQENLDHESSDRELSDSPIVELNLSLKKKPIFKRSFDYRLFLVVDDNAEFVPEVDLKSPSLFEQILAEMPGFVVAQPAAGVLDWFFPEGRKSSVVPKSDNDKLQEIGEFRESKLLKSPLYRLSDTSTTAKGGSGIAGFNAVSYRLDLLEDLELYNKKVATDLRSQFHLMINRPNPESKINQWVNRINYRRSWQTSIANVKLMNFVSRQLGTDRKDVQAICQDLLGVDLVCSLGGSYEVVETVGGIELIFSNAWPDFENPELPVGYQAPLLRWFRGGELRLSKQADGGRFELTGELQVERAPTGFALPSYQDFKGFFNRGGK